MITQLNHKEPRMVTKSRVKMVHKNITLEKAFVQKAYHMFSKYD